MGHLFVEDQLLNESGMEAHPLNPMTDPNLRRWPALQSKVGSNIFQLRMSLRAPMLCAPALAPSGMKI